MKVFASMLQQHSKWLMSSEQFRITYSPEKTKTAVLVEPRPHPYLRAVVDNVMHALGPKWNLHIFTSTHNEAWLKTAMEPHAYAMEMFALPNLTREQYSELLMMPSFWERIRTEDILIFQTDCIAFRPWDPAFEIYDYAGANYVNPAHTLHEVGGIQGGLSFRKRSAMLDCLDRVTQDRINDFRSRCGLPPISKEGMAEDVFFTHACAILQKKIPPVPLRRHIAVEAEFFPTPFAFHGWQHPYFNASQVRELLETSPFFQVFTNVPGQSMQTS